MLRPRLLSFVAVFVLLLGLIPLQAQETMNISIALPPFYEDTLKDAIESFEQANPDITVEIVTTNPPSYAVGEDIEAYFNEMSEYASSADVLLGDSQFNPVASRAGFFLNLAPLVNADSSLNIDEFFPAMWESYQWDGGIWAIPLAGDIVGLVYDVQAFDEAGLSYPDENWTLDDLLIAAEELTVYGEGDTIESAPITNFADAGLMAVAALGQPLYDPLGFESSPNFANPQLEAALEQWVNLQKDGYAAIPEGLEFTPIVFAPSVLVAFATLIDAEADFEFSTLPGGNVALQPVGAAISAGSENPEAAYRLIKFLTEDATAFTGLIGNPIPARESLFGTESNNPLLEISLPEELKEKILDYIQVAVPYSQTLFSNYVSKAATDLVSGDLDVATALSDMTSQALDDLEAATAYRETLNLTVNQTNTGVVGTGDITLRFGVVGFGPISNQEGWDAVIAEFIGEHPEVATVELERLSLLTGDTSLSDYHEKVDCFYQPGRLSSSEDLTLLLPIDPLLAIDPNISRDDFVGNSIGILSQNGVIYGLPLNIQPEVLYYNIDLFNAAGAILPYQGWSVNDFELALRTLRPDANSPAVFQSQTGGNYILALTAAYGGLPVDFRSSPVTVDLGSEANINALRQVLDLAKDGYIAYSPLAVGGLGALNAETLEDPAMYTQIISDVFGVLAGDSEDGENPYRPVTFPQGVDYSAVSYDIGGAYITAGTQFAQTCYDFITALSAEATLFTGMPARRSVLNSDEFVIAQGEAAVEFYNGLDEQLQQSNVLELPAAASQDFSAIGDSLAVLWLYKAMDAYVLEDADLEAELAEAQQFTLDYQACIVDIPTFNEVGDGDIQGYVARFAQCAVDVDESTRSLFVGLPLD